MTDKILIFDASSLISFAMNGLLGELRELGKNFIGKFIITSDVKQEIIDHPITKKRFELEALKLKQLLDAGILELPESVNVEEKELEKETQKVLDVANSTFSGRGRDIHIIDSGEASCLALSKILNQRKIRNVIAVDERTTRVLAEAPDNLRRIFQKKLHTKIIARKNNYKFFREFKIIRSCELAYVIHKKNLLDIKDPRALDAMLYALKFRGCSISDREIAEIKKIAGAK